MWDVSGVGIGRKAIQIASGNIFPFLSNANVGLSFPKWTRWMSRMCGTATHPSTHTHIHTHTLTWGGGGGGGGVMAQSLWFFRWSIRPADTQEEWIIYNHFLSGPSDWCDSWPPNSLNLVICHCWEKLNHSRTLVHPPLVLPMLPMLQRGQYGEQILDNTQQRNDFPFNMPPTCQNNTFPHCEQFLGDLYHVNWFTVYVHTPEMMYHYICPTNPFCVCQWASGRSQGRPLLKNCVIYANWFRNAVRLWVTALIFCNHNVIR